MVWYVNFLFKPALNLHVCFNVCISQGVPQNMSDERRLEDRLEIIWDIQSSTNIINSKNNNHKVPLVL